MRKRVLILAVGLAVLAGVCGVPGAAPTEIAPGDIRAVLEREGTSLRERPSAMGRASATLRHGTQVRVTEVRGDWINVQTVPAAGVTSASGWLRANRTVQPFALTQGGQSGPVAVRERGASQRDVSAAGRQFDEETETAYRGAHPDLNRFFPLVDTIEESVPDAEAVRRFVLEGRLGRPEVGE